MVLPKKLVPLTSCACVRCIYSFKMPRAAMSSCLTTSERKQQRGVACFLAGGSFACSNYTVLSESICQSSADKTVLSAQLLARLGVIELDGSHFLYTDGLYLSSIVRVWACAYERPQSERLSPSNGVPPRPPRPLLALPPFCLRQSVPLTIKTQEAETAST